MILKKTTVSFCEGETVYDVLVRTCKAAGVQLEVSYSGGYGSYYVEGIGHLYEFDCGQTVRVGLHRQRNVAKVRVQQLQVAGRRQDRLELHLPGAGQRCEIAPGKRKEKMERRPPKAEHGIG